MLDGVKTAWNELSFFEPLRKAEGRNRRESLFLQALRDMSKRVLLLSRLHQTEKSYLSLNLGRREVTEGNRRDQEEGMEDAIGIYSLLSRRIRKVRFKIAKEKSDDPT